jgi:hypothetical protein
MRPRSKFPPQTPAQRQAKCRAIKNGTWRTIPALTDEQIRALGGPPGRPALPSPQPHTAAALALPPPQKAPALPSPKSAPSTAIQKTFSPSATSLALPDADGATDGLRLTLPPAVADRLRSLLDRHQASARGAGKPLTAAERAEAQGLLDIAEFFVVQRLRNRLAA